MKHPLLIISFVLLFLSCDSNRQKEQQNIGLIASYVEAVEKLDHDLMESFLSDDYMGYGPSFNDSIGKTGAIASWKKNVDELYEKIDYKTSRNIAVTIDSGDNAGDWVSNWAELEITFKEDGKSVTIWANTVYKIEGDKIIESYTFYNEADALEQLGYVFINPNNF